MTATRAGTAPAPARETALTRQAAVGVLLAVVAAAVAFALHGTTFWGVDFGVFHGAGTTVLHGGSPYDAAYNQFLLFLYPPFAAVLFTPLGLLKANAAYALWTLLSVLALEGVVWMLLGAVGVGPRGRRATLTLAVTVAALPLSPILSNLSLGQVNLILMIVILDDLLHDRGRLRGIGVGVAAGIKLIPLIVILYFLATRRFRAAAVAAVSFAATVAIGFLLMPGASRTYWSGTFLDASRGVSESANPYNMSIRSMLLRLPAPEAHSPWLLLAISAVVGIGGLAVAGRAVRSGNEHAGIVACAVTGLLVSPTTWPAHWVWCVPLLVFWAGRTRRGTWSPYERLGFTALSLILLAPSYWMLRMFVEGDPGVQASFWPQLFVKIYAPLGLLILAAIAVFLWRGDRRAREGAPLLS
ncbi:glycosyltransferase 87 family protein [Streptosporangium sp. CA-135522]|uniref:glycosyltransferase 87 family protein n=1 Tax=Streptosporangium sp. CA-135522 TaxID=3240072 RepID=UPI003D8CCC2D